MKEIKCFKSYNNYFPQSFLESSLTDETKALKVKGDALKSLKKEMEADLLALSENLENSDLRHSQRQELITKIYKALGYYDLDKAPDFQKARELTVKGKKVSLDLEGQFRFKGGGELWILTHYPETAFSCIEDFAETDADKQSEYFFEEPSLVSYKNKPAAEAFKDVIDSIFDGDQSDCESLIINSGDKLYLLERGKWQEGPQAYLQLDLLELFSEINKTSYYQVAEALFSPLGFPIDSAENFHETLDRNAFKKASEVTKALRDTVRQSIEIIADEILRLHEATPLSCWEGKDFKALEDRQKCAEDIFDQTLSLIYRMLFMLFAESQDQAKGALPVNSKAYQLGYSIEKLRDLEAKPFLASQSENSKSHFIHESLTRAFGIYFNGYNTHREKTVDKEGSEHLTTNALGFSFPSLGTRLFDPKSTPIFNEIKLNDSVMKSVIQKLSIAKTGTGKKAKSHRVHYAGLGLNQLGAVYEGLLTLKPEILGERVILLEKDKKEIAHRFVPYNQKDKFKDKQFAHDENKSLITKEKGTFLLSPVGLERKFSASFYTPEVLTRFLAKEAVDTLLGDEPTLERMESLKILEPAMGSGAFLNAVVDEIAPKMAKLYEAPDKKAYEQKIQELNAADNGKNPVALAKIRDLKPQSPSFYLSKAKNHLMKHAVHGVDLNPTAVELAKISLWLNCLHEDGNLPFLDMKLRLGNSLVGGWVNRHEDEETGLPHWLLPPPNALDPHLKGTILGDKKRPFIENSEAKEKLKALQKDWAQLKTDKKSLAELKIISEKVKELYKTHNTLKKEYQHELRKIENPTEKDSFFQKYIEENKAYNQLRAMMDLWCSLWFWPHSELDTLPTAKSFLEAMKWLSSNTLSYGQEQNEELTLSGIPFLLIARRMSLKTKFLHYDLEFSDVFENGGFDLVLGNPPWAPVKWEESDFFELHSPGIHDLPGDSKQKHKRYSEFLDKNPRLVVDYRNEKAKAEGTANFLKVSETYPFSDSSKTNTYKYFYQRFYQAARPNGIHAMIAQDGILTDQGCLEIRPIYLKDLVKLFRFINYLKLFEDVAHLLKYMVAIGRKANNSQTFKLIDNLYHPDTVEKCESESPNAIYRGMKNENGDCELRGHPLRMVNIDQDVLKGLSKFSNEATAETIKLPIIHGQIELDILLNMAHHDRKLGIGDQIKWTSCFDESKSPKVGSINRKPGVSRDIKYAVMTGPNIFVGNPARKQPNPGCKDKGDFSSLDLTNKTECPDDFFPATVYQATEKGLKSREYLTKAPWGETLTDKYRIFSRGMVSTTGERTLSSAIIPPGPTHVHSMSTLTFQTNDELVYTAGLFQSIIYDFLSRTLSGGTIGQGIYAMFPTLNLEQLNSPLIDHLKVRTLRLNAISSHYSDLWKDQFQPTYANCEVDSKFSSTLPFSKLSKKWVRDTCIRDPRERDQALCEIDAIVALLFDFDKETLLNLYRSQFGVLQKNLQDLPNQAVDIGKYHFPRFEAMNQAYDQFAKIVGKGIRQKGTKKAGSTAANNRTDGNFKIAAKGAS